MQIEKVFQKILLRHVIIKLMNFYLYRHLKFSLHISDRYNLLKFNVLSFTLLPGIKSINSLNFTGYDTRTN